jgi:cation diffusion facilitator family transporter
MMNSLNIAKETLEPGRTPCLRIGIYSLLVNLSLVAIKLFLSFVSGSLALRADGIHSLVDVFASIALIIGLVLSRRKNKNFPYGLYKVENIVSVIISLLLFFTAYEIAAEAIGSKTVVVAYDGWVLGTVAVLILVPFFFGRYELKAGRRYNSPSLIADGSQFTVDVLGSTIVFLALLGQLFGFPLDRIAAGIIALFITHAAWGLLVSSMRVLLDASVSYEILDKIRSLIQAESAVSTIQNLIGRNSGRYIFVEANITTRTMDMKKAHLISQRIEQNIRAAVPNIDRILIHYEPEMKTWLRYAVPLSNREGQISEDFGISPYFALVDIDSKEKVVLRQEIISNPCSDLEKGRGIKAAEFILAHKPDIVVTRESLTGKGPGYALAEAGTEVLQTEFQTLDAILGDLHSKATAPN